MSVCAKKGNGVTNDLADQWCYSKGDNYNKGTYITNISPTFLAGIIVLENETRGPLRPGSLT